MKSKAFSLVREYAIITFAVFLVSAGVYFFKFPNNFSTGGVSGISVILGSLVKNVSSSSFVTIINVLLLIIGFIILGKGFAFKTVYGSLLMSGLLLAFERLVPMSKPLTDEPLLELAFSVLLPAFGSAILFNMSASTGGTDIAAMILKKFTNLDIGKALLVSDTLITVSSVFVFGIKTGLFSVLGLLAKSLVVDSVIENINLAKFLIIVTTEEEQVSECIRDKLHRGATKWHGSGVFTGTEKCMIITAVKRHQAVYLRRYIKQIDPHSFIITSNSSEIIGKGFRNID